MAGFLFGSVASTLSLRCCLILSSLSTVSRRSLCCFSFIIFALRTTVAFFLLALLRFFFFPGFLAFSLVNMSFLRRWHPLSCGYIFRLLYRVRNNFYRWINKQKLIMLQIQSKSTSLCFPLYSQDQYGRRRRFLSCTAIEVWSAQLPLYLRLFTKTAKNLTFSFFWKQISHN